MTPAPGDPGGRGGADDAGGDYEVVVHRDRRHLWAARARGLGRGGRTGLVRLAAYLRTPEGRHAAARTAQAIGAAAAVVAAVVVVRGRLQALARGARVLGAGVRSVTGAARTVARAARAAAGALGAAVRATRLGVPLRWLGSLVGWLTRSRREGPRRHVRCPDCHARVRGDAHVCYRCGYRPAGGASARPGDLGTIGAAARRRSAASGSARFAWRLLALRLSRTCPDCRRLMHADARVCAHCGYRRTAGSASPG